MVAGARGILNEVMTAERFPVLDRLAASGGFDVAPDTENYNVRFIVDDFEFGLQRMLDGIERYVTDRKGAVRRRAESSR